MSLTIHVLISVIYVNKWAQDAICISWVLFGVISVWYITVQYNAMMQQTQTSDAGRTYTLWKMPNDLPHGPDFMKCAPYLVSWVSYFRSHVSSLDNKTTLRFEIALFRVPECVSGDHGCQRHGFQVDGGTSIRNEAGSARRREGKPAENRLTLTSIPRLSHVRNRE